MAPTFIASCETRICSIVFIWPCSVPSNILLGSRLCAMATMHSSIHVLLIVGGPYVSCSDSYYVSIFGSQFRTPTFLTFTSIPQVKHAGKADLC